jgi:hypothetical protein
MMVMNAPLFNNLDNLNQYCLEVYVVKRFKSRLGSTFFYKMPTDKVNTPFGVYNTGADQKEFAMYVKRCALTEACR